MSDTRLQALSEAFGDLFTSENGVSRTNIYSGVLKNQTGN